ncbi:recombinase family protein [Streptomyces sp. YKOK-I1]
MPQQLESAIATVQRVVRCFIYARISEDREGAHLATKRQIDDCQDLAAQLSTPLVEYRVVRVFEDNDLSAYSGKPRPDYKAMLEALARDEGDCVLAWHTDRLHRSPVELEQYIDACSPRAIETRTVKAGHLDLSTATGRMIARQLGVQARYEVERMIERSKRARDQKASHGEYSGGPRPFGYEPDGVTPRTLQCPDCGKTGPDGFTLHRTCDACDAVDRFSRDLACQACNAKDTLRAAFTCDACGTGAAFEQGSEAALVGQATIGVLTGISLRALAKDLAEAGAVSVHGKGQGINQLRQIVKRPRNAGLMQHRGQVIGRADWMPLVDEPTWRSALAVLEDPARYTSGTNVRKYLGSGIYECAVCHGKLTGFPRKKARRKGATGPADAKQPAYRCTGKGCIIRDGEALDEYVQLYLLNLVRDADVVRLTAHRGPQVDVKAVQEKMRAARRRLDELAESLGAGEMDMQEWRVAAAPARKRLRDAEEEMKDAVKGNPIAELLAAEDPVALWRSPGFDLSRQRAAIDYLMRVRVGRARPGRQPDGSYFDRVSVSIEWR